MSRLPSALHSPWRITDHVPHVSLFIGRWMLDVERWVFSSHFSLDHESPFTDLSRRSPATAGRRRITFPSVLFSSSRFGRFRNLGLLLLQARKKPNREDATA